MERLVSLGAVLAFVSLCHTSNQQSVGTVVVDDGRVGIGLIAGGNFGPGSFSIGGSMSGRPRSSVNVNEDNKDGQQIIVQTATHHKGQQENYQPPQSGGSSSSNTQLYPVKPLSTHVNPGQGGHRGEGSSEGGQILIGAVVLNNNKHNKGNKKKNGNKQPVVADPATLGAVFGNNGENNEFPNAGNSFSNTGEQGSIIIGSITGGNFEEANHGNTGNTNAGQEAQYFNGNGVNDHGAVKAGVGSSHAGYDSGTSEEPWIWDR